MSCYYLLNSITGFQELLREEEIVNNIIKRSFVTNNNKKYNLISYDKSVLSIDLIPTKGLIRSVILSEKNKLLSFSPPKSIPFDTFSKKNVEKNDSLVAEEFIDGTMINLFWDETIGLNGSWELATRNNVGADVSFYKTNDTKTFRQLFMETVELVGLNLATLDHRYCYSFVLQHPYNRIVVPFKKPQLYLVELYEIVNEIDGTMKVFPQGRGTKTELFLGTGVLFPEIYTWGSYEDLKLQFASSNTPYNVVGIIIKDLITGQRTKLRNPVYETVRQLRGNQSKLQYQYLALRKEGKVKDYLKYYPEHKKEFALFREMLHQFTITLYDNYVSCYIKKERVLNQFPENFRTHMFQIHQRYLNEMKEKKQHVTNTTVIHFVNDMPTPLQMYSINYALRKRRVDFLTQSTESVVV